MSELNLRSGLLNLRSGLLNLRGGLLNLRGGLDERLGFRRRCRNLEAAYERNLGGKLLHDWAYCRDVRICSPLLGYFMHD